MLNYQNIEVKKKQSKSASYLFMSVLKVPIFLLFNKMIKLTLANIAVKTFKFI